MKHTCFAPEPCSKKSYRNKRSELVEIAKACNVPIPDGMEDKDDPYVGHYNITQLCNLIRQYSKQTLSPPFSPSPQRDEPSGLLAESEGVDLEHSRTLLPSLSPSPQRHSSTQERWTDLDQCYACEKEVKAIDVKATYPIFKKMLGKGAYGRVELRCSDTECVAVKVSFHSPNASDGFYFPQDILREISALKAVGTQNHPNIVRFLGFQLSKKIKIVLEKAETSLRNYLKSLTNHKRKLPDHTAARFIYQIIRGMAFINGKGIWHRDLKPDNILMMKDGSLKITDFGLARGGPFQWISMTDMVYTLWWRPPEILMFNLRKKNPLIIPYDGNAESYSVGMVFFNILSAGHRMRLQNMFSGQDEQTQLDLILSALGAPSEFYGDALANKYQSDISPEERFRDKGLKDVSDDCIDLLLQLLNPLPSKRMTVFAALDHPFVADAKKILDKIKPAPIAQQMKMSELQIKTPKICEFNSWITQKDLSTLLSWLLEVNHDFHNSYSTYFLGIHILRCFLNRRVVKLMDYDSYEHFQLVGGVALYIASLYMEQMPPDLYEYVYMLGHHPLEVKEVELVFFNKTKEMIEVTGATFHLPTCFVFLAGAVEKQYTDKITKKDITNRSTGIAELMAIAAISPLGSEYTPQRIAELAINMWIKLNPDRNLHEQDQKLWTRRDVEMLRKVVTEYGEDHRWNFEFEKLET